ncbi:MAG TPA: hypothetical protein VLE48_09170 [Terriglobales bacterium]|nr:hypothetical protein [Terriglobales bacterium]
MRRSDEPSEFKPKKRTSQIVFGERQHLSSVLDSILRFGSISERVAREKLALDELIAARTAELNRINPDWDQKLKKARDANTSADELAEMAQNTPADDYLLLRTLAEHPNTPSSVLSLLAQHSYDAVKENVARHPNTHPKTLEKLAADPTRPLWFLVACNPATPEELREQLKQRMWQEAGS